MAKRGAKVFLLERLVRLGAPLYVWTFIVAVRGTISSSISKNVDLIISGENPGPIKIKKANELGLKIISEEDFYKIIET